MIQLLMGQIFLYIARYRLNYILSLVVGIRVHSVIGRRRVPWFMGIEAVKPEKEVIPLGLLFQPLETCPYNTGNKGILLPLPEVNIVEILD